MREPFVRSKRPTSGGRSGALVSSGRSNTGAAAGKSAAGAGSTGLVTISATATGFGTLAITRAVGIGCGRRGASTRTDGNITGSADGILNTAIDRGLAVDVVSDARVGTTAVSTPASVAWTTTLSHRPVLEREPARARVLKRASPNRTDMCRTDLKCRSVPLRRAAVCWRSREQAKCRPRAWPA